MTENQKKVLAAVRDGKHFANHVGSLQAGSALTPKVQQMAHREAAALGRVEAWLIVAFSRGDMQATLQQPTPPLDTPTNPVQS